MWFTAGDHLILVGEVVRFEAVEPLAEPLVFYQGSYGTFTRDQSGSSPCPTGRCRTSSPTGDNRHKEASMRNRERAVGLASRRRALRQLTTFMAGSPLLTLVDANGDPVEYQQQAAGAQVPSPGGQGAPRPAADRPGTVRPPAYRDEIMSVINLHEFEDAAKKSAAALPPTTTSRQAPATS